MNKKTIIRLITCILFVSMTSSILLNNTIISDQNQTSLDNLGNYLDEIDLPSISADPNSITVTNPTSSSSWQAGWACTIEWTWTGSFSSVSIDLYKGVSVIKAESTSNDGSHDFVAPSDCSTDTDYRIKITEWGDSSVYDYSDYFEITEVKSITVTNPTSSSSWQAGSGYNIDWSSTGSISTVQIELYKDSTLQDTISSSTTNDGSHYWDIPSSTTASTNYRIKIYDKFDSYVYDYSDYFEIMDASPTKSITVTSPTSSSSWLAGSGYNINWSSTGSILTVQIELYEDSTLQDTISFSTTNDGSYYWDIPSSTTASANYRIKIFDTSNSSVYDYSNYFSITSSTNFWIENPIHIDDSVPACNWDAINSTYDWCNGAGTWSNPYVIENVTINGGNSSNCIYIGSSNVYFKIKSCTLYNSGEYQSGIFLSYANNGQLIENNCSFNQHRGISLWESNNNTIQGNFANNNNQIGIALQGDCDNNKVLSNTANNNAIIGISLYGSNHNNIWNNEMSKNERGIFIDYSDHNFISENDAIDNNNAGITFVYGYNNTVSQNIANNNGGGIVMHNSTYNIISNNTISNNDMTGIFMEYSHHNFFLENNVNDNGNVGMHLYNSNNNNVKENKFLGNNDGCITEEDCNGNDIEDNECDYEDPFIFGYNLLFIISIISVISVLLIKKRIKP